MYYIINDAIKQYDPYFLSLGKTMSHKTASSLNVSYNAISSAIKSLKKIDILVKNKKLVEEKHSLMTIIFKYLEKILKHCHIQKVPPKA